MAPLLVGHEKRKRSFDLDADALDAHGNGSKKKAAAEKKRPKKEAPPEPEGTSSEEDGEEDGDDDESSEDGDDDEEVIDLMCDLALFRVVWSGSGIRLA